mgnify:CR=1 FL=1
MPFKRQAQCYKRNTEINFRREYPEMEREGGDLPPEPVEDGASKNLRKKDKTGKRSV